MKEKKTILQILDLMIPPAFSVRGGLITAVNSGAAQRMISEGTQIQALLQTGHAEYAALDGGKLFLSLNLMGEVTGASVNRIDDVDIFILEDAEDQKALQAMALAAQELRQPLANVMSAADRMFPRLPDDSDTQDQVSQMNRRLFQMLRVLGNMSDAFLWASGAFHPELRDVQGALAEILEGLEPLADGFGTQLEYDLISGPIFSLIDTDKMERAVYNMLSNAMKFAPSGSTIKVKTLDKEVELKIPAGTQSGTRFRIIGEGMPHLQSSRKGNLYVEVKVTVPKRLKEEQKEALLNYAHLMGEDCAQYKGKSSWLDKIIDKFK